MLPLKHGRMALARAVSAAAEPTRCELVSRVDSQLDFVAGVDAGRARDMFKVAFDGPSGDEQRFFDLALVSPKAARRG